jgi:HEAT repeat protein
MGRLLWPLACTATFVAGMAAGGIALRATSPVQEVEHRDETVMRLQQQVANLQARLRAREGRADTRAPGTATQPGSVPPGQAGALSPTESRALAAAVLDDRRRASTPGGSASGPPAPIQPAGTPSPPGAPGARGATASTPTVEAALDRFYRYLEATGSGVEGRERWQKARELVQELRGMGDAAAQALMHVLAAGTDSDERRAAARLLGTLQAGQALPLLKDVIEREDDVLLRRAAAQGLRRLQTAESLPVMERLLTHPAEDRYVRISAAVGLAESGRPLGVNGLAQIFHESAADGRGREIAFRSLAALKDERPLPFMRQLVTAQAEPGYRLQAIKYVAAQNDRQALGALQAVMNSPAEQASIRDAAAQAYATLSGR